MENSENTQQQNSSPAEQVNEGDTVTLQVNGKDIRGKIVHKCSMYVIQPISDDDDNEHEEECITVSDELAGWMIMEVIDVDSIELVHDEQEQNTHTPPHDIHIFESTNKEFVEFYTEANQLGAKFIPYNLLPEKEHHACLEHTLIQCVSDKSCNGDDMLHIKCSDEQHIYMPPSCTQLILSEESQQKLLAYMESVIPVENRNAQYLKGTGIFHLSAGNDNQLFLCMCKNN